MLHESTHTGRAVIQCQEVFSEVDFDGCFHCLFVLSKVIFVNGEII